MRDARGRGAGRPRPPRPGGRTAVAPPGAPAEVVRAIAAANKITRKPYKWGGGHGRWWDSGYDCSGTVSYVLHKAGLLDASRDSTGFMSYGEAQAAAAWITTYANGGHAYMVIAGLRFDTSGRGEDGPRWRLRVAQRRAGSSSGTPPGSEANRRARSRDHRRGPRGRAP